MKNIVIASGKGGTGKTTVAVNLAYYLSIHEKEKVRLLDCDVEAPNDNLFLNATFDESKEVKIPRPVWIEDKCKSCGECVSVCNYNAIAKVKNKILIFNELCHSCGACMHLCSNQALKKQEIAIGKIELANNHTSFAFGHGILKIGESLAPIVIKHLKKHMDKDAINLIDASPGTTCPVVKSMEGMDYCLLVTEPTPFGLNDLTLAAALAAKLNLPTGIIINRSQGEDAIIEDFAKNHQIPIVGKIPFNKQYAVSYSSGKILIEIFPELKDIFSKIYLNIKKEQKIPIIHEKRDHDIGEDESSFFEDTKTSNSNYKEMVVISGKGGTGKTTITAALSELMENKVLADNDVDASNLHLLCRPEILFSKDFIGGKVYSIDQEKCCSCGLCASSCQFEAIKYNTNNKPSRYIIDEISCEGCGFCFHLCNADAISEKPAISGKWYISKTSNGYLSHAKLGIGEENSGKLVSFVRDNAAKLARKYNASNILNDGPPGTGCPVISAITGVNLALVVTEPTLSGIHDMKRALDLAKHFNVPALIVVNKFDLNITMTEKIENIAKEYKSKVIGKIPFDKNVHDALMKGETIITYGKGDALKATIAMWNILKEEMLEL